MKRALFALTVVSLFVSASFSQIGIFEERADVGDLILGPGQASFDNGTYTMDALGTTIGRRSFADEFNFVYSEMSGSFAIECDPFPLLPDGEGGIMIRQSLDQDSVHGSWLRIGASIPGGNTNAAEGSVFPHLRTIKGGGTIVDGDQEPGGISDNNISLIKIERIGNSLHFYTFSTSDEWVLIQSEAVPMSETVLAGLAATANGAELLGEFEFNDVAVTEFPLWVGRALPTEDHEPGASLTGVTLTAKARDGETVDAVVEEVGPPDAVISNVQASGGTLSNVSDNGFTWTLNGHSGEATVTYDITLGTSGSASFTGTFSDGINPESFIGGDMLLPKVPALAAEADTIELNPDNPVVIQVEDGVPVRDPVENGDWGLFYDPDADGGITMVGVSGAIAGWLEFPINIPAGYGDLFIFGHVRGEDGNSDSFFVDVEFEPINDPLTIWDSGGGRSLHFDWVKSREPADFDPRPFFGLTEGENSLFIAPREDSTSIDWLAVTNDPSIDPAAFDPFTGEIIDPREGLTGTGIFQANMDIAEAGGDNLGESGAAGFDPDTGTYTVIGSGNDIWNTADNFHFLYSEVTGDVTLRATVNLDQFSGNATWAKAGPMIRNELEPESAFGFSMIRTQGRDFGPQWRLFFGENAAWGGDETLVSGGLTNRVEVSRSGTTITYAYVDSNGERVEALVLEDVEMDDPVFAGLAVTAHDVGTLSIGTFTDVELITGDGPVTVDEWSLY